MGGRVRRGARPRPEPVPVTGTEADLELAGTLHNLDSAGNYADWIYDIVAPYLGGSVLEIGAGHGTLTERLARGRAVTATDVSPRCVAVLEERYAGSPDVRVALADVRDAPSLGRFDAVVLINVLEHVADDTRAVRALARALAPGGHLVLVVPALRALFSDFDRRIGHYRRYERDELAVLAGAAGLDVVELRALNLVGAAAWWVMATRLGLTPTRRWATLTFDRFVVPVVSRVERRWPPPVGQSLLLVARLPREAPGG